MDKYYLFKITLACFVAIAIGCRAVAVTVLFIHQFIFLCHDILCRDT
jgi:hypothetical protein